MYIYKKYLTYSFLMGITLPIMSFGQNTSNYKDNVNKYLSANKNLAITEQVRSGVPASITLAQGIFETAAGTSNMCTVANNHFGIKCKGNWIGDTYTADDETANECFRKYESAWHSYMDHSNFLTQNKRYASLFNIIPTDYRAWAYGLKQCGYATNPVYAEKLIQIIENFNLQNYTVQGIKQSGGNADSLLALVKEKNSVCIQPGADIAVVNPQNKLDVKETSDYQATMYSKKDRKSPYDNIPDSIWAQNDPSYQSSNKKQAAKNTFASTQKPYLADNNYQNEAQYTTTPSRKSYNANAPQQPVVVAQTTTPSQPKYQLQSTQIQAANTTTYNSAPQSQTNTAVSAPNTPQTVYKPTPAYSITSFNDINGFYAKEGDMLLEMAIKNSVRYSKLLEINNLKDEPLPSDRFIYLKPMHKSGAHATHIVSNGESLADISWKEGVQLSELAKLNHLSANAVPMEGSTIQLQNTSEEAPKTVTQTFDNGNTQTTTTTTTYTQTQDYTKDYVPGGMKNSPTVTQTVTTTPAVENKVNTIAQNTENVPQDDESTNSAVKETVTTTASTETVQEKVTEPEPDPNDHSVAGVKARFDRLVYANKSKSNSTPQNTSTTIPASSASTVKKQSDSLDHVQVKSHVVAKGDTYYGIAKKYGITLQQLYDFNNISADTPLTIGKFLRVQ